MVKRKRSCGRPSRYRTGEDPDTPQEDQPSTSAPTAESNAANIQAIMSSLAAIQSQLAAQKEPPSQTNTDREPKRKKPHTQKNDETSGEEDENSTEEEGSDPDSDLESDPESNPTPPNMYGSLIGNAVKQKDPSQ